MKKLLLLLMVVVTSLSLKGKDYTITFTNGSADGTAISTSQAVSDFVTDNSYVGEHNKFTDAVYAYGKSKLGLKLGKSGDGGTVGFALEDLDSYSISVIKINAAYYDNTKDAKMGIKVYINSQEVGSVTDFQQATLSEKSIILDSPVAPTAIKLVTYNTANDKVSSNYQARAYVQSITFVGEDGGDPVEKHLGELTGSYNDTAIGTDPITVDEGTTFTFSAENADEYTVKVNDDDPTPLDIVNGAATWTPGVCENAAVTVTATMNGDTTESKALTFTLTVKEEEPENPNFVKEVLTTDVFSNSGTGYSQGTFTSSLTSISYSAVFSKSNGFQFNSNNKNGGKSSELIVTSNQKGYKLRKVEISFYQEYPQNEIEVYANTEAYTPVAELGNAPQKDGDKLGTIGTANGLTASITLDENSSYTAVALFPKTTGAIIMSSITLTWEVVNTPPVEAPADVEMSFDEQFSEFVVLGDEEITVEEGVSLTFTAERASSIVVYDIDNEEEPVELAKNEEGNNFVSWTPNDNYIFNVVASNEGGNSEYPMTQLIYIPFDSDNIPEFITVTENDKLILEFSCDTGKLMIQSDDGEWQPSNEGPKYHRVDLSTLADGDVVTISAKAVSVDGTKETETVTVKVDNHGIYVEPSVEAPVFVEPEFDPNLVEYGAGIMFAEQGSSVTFTAQEATSIKVVGMWIDGEIDDAVFAEGENTVTWVFTNPGDYLFNVIAENEGGTTKFAEEDIELCVEPVVFEEGDSSHITFDIEDDTHLSITTTKGVLKIKKTRAGEAPASIAMRAEDEDWFDANKHSQYHKEELASLTEPIIFSAKATTENGEISSAILEKTVDSTGILAGVENVSVDSNNAEAEYFNLQGVRVKADLPGIYIMRRGNHVSKVAIP